MGEREAAGKTSIYRGPLLLAYDRWLNTMDPDDLPALATEKVTLTRTSLAPAVVEPWIALETYAADGTRLVLCDFASAGAAGTPYRTWLPLDKR